MTAGPAWPPPGLPAKPPGVERILLIGAGAIGAAQLPSLVGMLKFGYGFDVAVCLTAAGRDFVSPRALAALTGRPVVPPDWPAESGPAHVEWADWAQGVIVWPATLNFLSRCAFGLADSLPAAIVLSTTAPVVFAPSVAAGAAEGGPLRRALRVLRQDGHGVVGPVMGHAVSTGELSPGACAPPEAVVEELTTRLRASTSVPAEEESATHDRHRVQDAAERAEDTAHDAV
ncbi:flavoprotein [Streptomyces alfalfae]|uniref:Flavoprotein n=1 Tax=Streptomyces alfalfae TaxID=1642299 RepID=A0A7T4U0S1_9ACTN|nr:flavoprotein [Streptomyces alfalfae]QQC92088.1 flavoprotein [Streptomyces alfalfae]